MSLQETVSAERVHIAWFGRRNAGKSSLVNAVTAQDVSIVSDVPGTTTDPVRKAMELLPLGPVLMIDTPGIDDEGALGELRVARTNRILAETDIAVLAVDGTKGFSAAERELAEAFLKRSIPWILVFTKADLTEASVRDVRTAEGKALAAGTDIPVLFTSAHTGEGIHELKETLGACARKPAQQKHIVTDLLSPGSIVILVCPIDASAPKGRLILPQQAVLRELLDEHHTTLVCQPEELTAVIASLRNPPALVITDSQVFGKVDAVLPKEIPLTSFSILFARYKGDLETLIRGAEAIEGLRDGDCVLIAEGCTHHRQCGDIGTVKLPAWIEKHTGVKPSYTFVSGGDFPVSPSDFRLIIHCGGCMLSEREMKNRLASAEDAGVPIVNYGVAIAHMHGILKRSLAPLDKSGINR